jgi:phenylacetate-coenzyme A ligase PaaK-like adenylate-forming protein
VPPGQVGERLLVTVFDRRTQPLIRYEISDMVRPIDGACECGRPFRLIEGIEGRIEDVLHFPAHNGSAGDIPIHPNVFHDLLETVPATGWQVQQEHDGVSVRLTGLRDHALCASLSASIQQALASRGAFVPAVRITLVEALERGRTGKAPLILANPRAGRAV